MITSFFHAGHHLLQSILHVLGHLSGYAVHTSTHIATIGTPDKGHPQSQLVYESAYAAIRQKREREREREQRVGNTILENAITY